MTTQQWKDAFALNITTVVSWLSFFYAIKYLEPAVMSAISMSVGPVLTLFLAPIFLPATSFSRGEVFAALGIFSGVLLLTLSSVQGHSAVGILSTRDLIYGLMNCLIGGISIVGNTLYSKRLSDSGWTAGQIMSRRFYLLILVSLLFGWSSITRETFSSSMIAPFLLISFLGIIIPLYSLQLGIQRCEPLVVSLALSIGPVFSFLLQRFDQRLALSLSSFVGIAFICGFTVVGALFRSKRSTVC
jgi:drug/metabolite transporter (DMT)-like permease